MAKTKKAELAKAAAPGALEAGFDYGDMMGAGYGGTGKDDFSIPYLTLLQDGSPQCKKKDGAYIEGAEEGMLFNTVTKEVFNGKDGILFQPCATQHVFVEWKPRTAGGGLVAVHKITDQTVLDSKAAAEKYGKFKIGENDLVETFYMVGQHVDEDGQALGQLMITYTSTKIKVYKGCMSTLHSFLIPTSGGKKMNPPLFANLLRVTSMEQTNAGQTSANFVLSPAKGSVAESLLPPDSDLVASGYGLSALVEAGDAKIDHGGGQASEAPKEEAPF
ncbi:MAG: hypothetical protein JRC86_00825 [Deltaproteobacteria bacterium]|nr:hypothetical protein [Deltaproteobacteria bacterium]